MVKADLSFNCSFRCTLLSVSITIDFHSGKPQSIMFHQASQTQLEAVVDLAIWAMYLDNTIRVQENEELDSLIERLNEHAEIPLQSYVNGAIARIRDTRSDKEHLDAHLMELSNRLGTDEMRRYALDYLMDMFLADSEVTVAENSFFARVRAAFTLPDPKRDD